MARAPTWDSPREELKRYLFPPTDDPEVLERRRTLAEWVLENVPGVRDEIIEEGLLLSARRAVRIILAARGLALSREDDAQLDACTDLDTLGRWQDQALDTASAVEALR